MDGGVPNGVDQMAEAGQSIGPGLCWTERQRGDDIGEGLVAVKERGAFGFFYCDAAFEAGYGDPALPQNEKAGRLAASGLPLVCVLTGLRGVSAT